MKTATKTALVIIFVFAAIFCLAGLMGSGKGIVALEGYPHGVVICGEATVINEGHENDSEVKELMALAEKECAKYKEGE